MTSPTRSIDVTKVDAGSRIRNVRPERAAAMAESIAEHGQLQPIKVIETVEGYRLVFGEHRLVAVRDHLRLPMIDAIVATEATFGGEAKRRIEEIVENFVQFPMTVLEQAVALADWKDLYEAQNNTAGHGGKRQKKGLTDQNAKFASCFTEASAEVLGCSKRKVEIGVQIARGVAEPIRRRLADHPIADHQSELLALAQEPELRQASIVGLLLAEPPQASTVAGAIAVLDRKPEPVQLTFFDRMTEHFSGLARKKQFSFFDLHAELIEEWLAERDAASSRRSGKAS